MFIDELRYVAEEELAALITVMHRVLQRNLPVMLVPAKAQEVYFEADAIELILEHTKGYPYFIICSPSHGDTAFTVPLFDEFMKRIMPGGDWNSLSCASVSALTHRGAQCAWPNLMNSQWHSAVHGRLH